MSLLCLFEERISTPLGQLIVLTDSQGNARAADWADYEQRLHTLLQRQYVGQFSIQPASHCSTVTQSLVDYFDGNLQVLSSVKNTVSGTPFQQLVWRALQQIPVGSTWSYAQLAHYVGRPKAVRAVGSANGANPLSILIPCHRVIGSNQGLGGYAGGLFRKQWLLEHEGVFASGS